MLAVIGGSGLYRFEEISDINELSPDTPFGSPSDKLIKGSLNKKEVIFLSRHGRDHAYPPHLIPYRANLWALKKAGAQRIIGVSAVGGINRRFSPGDFVVINSFIDLTRSRETTYFEGRLSKKPDEEWRTAALMREGKVVHVDMTHPYCPQMSEILIEILEDLRLTYHPGGTYACTEGPRFETPAEIRMLESLGADVVGMTGVPEVVLARELEMCYAGLAVVANPAAGISEGRLTSDEVLEMMSEKEEEIRTVIRELVKRLPEERTCPCGNSLEGAVV